VFKVEFTVQAIEDLSRLDKPIAQRVSRKIDWLSENFEKLVPEPLTGHHKGKYKLRIGDWRTVCTVNYPQKVITILAVATGIMSIKFGKKLLT